MNNKYCSNCKQANPQERTFCFFCKGYYFVNSLDESSGKGVKRKNESRPTKKVEEIESGEEDVIEKNQRKQSEILIDNGQFEELIEAQNRTTHAVRAFVRFLFIQLSATTAAFVIWNWSQTFADQQECYTRGTNCGGNTFLQFVAVIIWIAGIFFSSWAGWDELEKSRVD